MSWTEQKEPTYEMDLRIEGIELTIQYDVNSNNENDNVDSPNDIQIKRIIHQGVNIKRLVRG